MESRSVARICGRLNELKSQRVIDCSITVLNWLSVATRLYTCRGSMHLAINGLIETVPLDLP